MMEHSTGFACLELLLGVMANAHLSSSVAALQWPEGLYGLPRAISGCPYVNTVDWKTGFLFQDCENTNPQTSRSPSYHMAGFVTKDVQREFCMKNDTQGDTLKPPWPDGQYCLYQGGDVCPTGMKSGWVVWDDEREDVTGNRNHRNGTLPIGSYKTNTKFFFCCSTSGDKQTPIDLPLTSPFYLIAYASSSCQMVRGATATREFIYYETEYYTLSTKNDYGGAHPYRVTRTRYGHTIYYCYYNPNYCPPLTHFTNGHVYPPRCARAQSNAYNDTCIARCNRGFVPRDGHKILRTRCQEDGTWSDVLDISCIPQPTHVTTMTSSTPTSSTRTAIQLTDSPGKASQTMNSSSTPNTVTNTTSITSEISMATGSSNTQAAVLAKKESIKNSKPSQNTKLTNESERLHPGVENDMRSRARLVAGIVSAAIVCVGVVFVFGYRKLHAKKEEEMAQSKTKKPDNSKSLEELLTGRNVIPRTVSEENLISRQSSERSSQIECPVKIDQNPLYESIDKIPPPRMQIRMSHNILYESIPELSRELDNIQGTTSDGAPRRSKWGTL